MVGLASSIVAAAALAVGGTALVVHAIDGCSTTTAHFNASADAPGAATPAAAIASYVNRTPLPHSGWKVESKADGTYRSGKATVTVSRLSNGRWQVTGVRYPSCKYH